MCVHVVYGDTPGAWCAAVCVCVYLCACIEWEQARAIDIVVGHARAQEIKTPRHNHTPPSTPHTMADFTNTCGRGADTHLSNRGNYVAPSRVSNASEFLSHDQRIVDPTQVTTRGTTDGYAGDPGLGTNPRGRSRAHKGIYLDEFEERQRYARKHQSTSGQNYPRQNMMLPEPAGVCNEPGDFYTGAAAAPRRNVPRLPLPLSVVVSVW